MHLRTDRTGVVNRRAFLHSAATGAAGLAVLGWKDAVTLNAAELRKRGMGCILLFMNGGPSQFETFDPKPGASTGGPTKGIASAVSGIQVAEHWPMVAKQLKDVALIRSMTNKEGAHPRAVYQLKTGYLPSGAVKYPSFGCGRRQGNRPAGFRLAELRQHQPPRHDRFRIPRDAICPVRRAESQPDAGQR